MKYLHIRLTTVVVASAILSFGTPSAADDKPDSEKKESQQTDETLLFDEIPSVFGASKYEQKVTEAPSSVTIVTAEEIEKYGYRTLGDILRGVRGFYATWDRNYDYVGVRGFGRPGDYNTRVLVLVDGHRQNDNIYDGATIGTDFPVDIDLVERVEVVRGPSSSLYGTSAFFGVINVITKRGRDFTAPEISFSTGSYGTHKARASYGNRWANGVEMLVSGTLFRSDGHSRLFFEEFDDPSTNNGFADNADQHDVDFFFGELSYKDFTFQGVYNSRDKTVPTGAYEVVFNDPNNFTRDERSYFNMKYEHRFASQSVITGRVAYDRYYYYGTYPYDWAEEEEEPPYIVLNEDDCLGTWLTTELQWSGTFFDKHRFIAGGEYRYNFRQDQGNWDEEVYLDDHRTSSHRAVYIQDEFTIVPKLILNAGLRHDQYETFGGTTNPRLAVIYSPVESLALKYLYGDAFRAPNAYELYYHDAYISQKPNPHLRPETITTNEFVVEKYFTRQVRGVVSVFDYDMRNLINFVTDPEDDLLVFQNVDRIDAHGFEAELEGKWPSLLDGRVSYAYQNAKDSSTGEELTNSPKHLGQMSLNVPIVSEKLYAGLEVIYMSERRTVQGSVADDFFLTNLTFFSSRLLDGLKVSASVYNLLNARYGDPGSEEHLQPIILQDGRHFRLLFTYQF